MARAIRDHDWPATPLGPLERWPQALRHTVSLILASDFPMYVVWGPQRCSLYNDAFVPILGSKHPAALGMPIAELWGEIWDQIGPLVASAFKGETSYFEDLPVLLVRNGYPEQTYFTFSYSGIEGDTGQVEGMFCVCLETTAAYLAGQRRRTENEKLQQMFQQAPGFIAVLRGPNHVFEMANRAFTDVVGQRSLVGKSVAEAMPETVGQGFLVLLDEVYRTGQPHVGRTVRYDAPAADGKPRAEKYVDFVYQPMFDEAGQPSGIFVQGHDVTEQFLAQKALIQADRHKDQFIATLAHELRNPLAPIRTAARLLEMPGVAPATVAAAAPIISRQVDHMARLLDDLLDTARITKGQIVLQTTRVAVDKVIDIAIEAARPLIDARGQHLSVVHADGSIELEADPVRLTEIVSNLLTNAAKYSDRNGAIRVESRLDRGMCAITVQDNGIGLPPTALKSVFEIFSQETPALERSEGGLGIGLALAKGLAELHGGTIEALSAGLGQGSSFVVRLPLAPGGAGADHPPTGQRAAAAPQPPLRILVADDNADQVETLAGFLEVLGHRVATAHDGRRALELARDTVPEVAILDIGMPGMNGYELARAIRNEAWGRGMLLVAATGWGQEEDKAKAAAAGFDVHLTKPFSMDRIEDIVRQHHRAP
jgi:signal transduction histidine kinase/CheY-like chemotaxis protein